MKIFVAGVSSERQYVRALDSIFKELQPGDDDSLGYDAGAPGWIARIELCDAFLEQKQFDALFQMDMDMLFPPDTLERLRSHDLDMVTGHYFKRKTDPMMSIIQVKDPASNRWLPMEDVPEHGLHEVACTGMGCVLIKREVIDAVAQIPGIIHPFMPGPIPELHPTKIYGQDIRFFFYANMLGYKLWLDADVEAAHGCTFWMTRYLYKILRPHQDDEWQQEMEKAEWETESTTSNASKNWKDYLAG